ncbi:MAG TPA: adenosylcobinamide-phosphate synthase CbiB [Candidatus Nitrosotalea sp.]|nr:adenosylcobinamide-phosphate synthase CbiB [Candidatus Nitrosotalea sp.]
MADRGLILGLAIALDLAFGEPRGRRHPVAMGGRLMGAAHRPARARAAPTQLAWGAAALLAFGTAAAGLGWAAERAPLPRPARIVLLGILLKPTFSIRGLLEEGGRVATELEQGRLAGARVALRALVSRPTGSLDSPLAASAAIESVAENLADSIAAPLLYYVLFGLPGAAAYRVVNTADAMFGYRGETEWLGKPAARVDDLLGWVPSRLSALALILAAATRGGPLAARRAWQTCRSEGGRTASPNAGRPMAAMAGALGRRLEKKGAHTLGSGLDLPAPDDVRAALSLVARSAGLIAILAGLASRRR